jgi:hypothetical protein
MFCYPSLFSRVFLSLHPLGDEKGIAKNGRGGRDSKKLERREG